MKKSGKWIHTNLDPGSGSGMLHPISEFLKTLTETSEIIDISRSSYIGKAYHIVPWKTFQQLQHRCLYVVLTLAPWTVGKFELSAFTVEGPKEPRPVKCTDIKVAVPGV